MTHEEYWGGHQQVYGVLHASSLAGGFMDVATVEAHWHRWVQRSGLLCPVCHALAREIWEPTTPAP